MVSVARFPPINRIQINSSGIITPEIPDFKIKDGAIELFENMFGQKVENDLSYTKEDLLELAIMSCTGSNDSNEDREPLIMELLDNIFEDSEKMKKD
jgi:hypothetical protein